MHWVLECQSKFGDWVEVYEQAVPKLSSAENAFEYYFIQHGRERSTETEYRLAPRFSTVPVNVVLINGPAQWAIQPKVGHRCKACGEYRK
jgi:hypothetical protein